MSIYKVYYHNVVVKKKIGLPSAKATFFITAPAKLILLDATWPGMSFPYR